MRRQILIITAVLALFALPLLAQQGHTIMFYNVENLFDTINDPHTKDHEFTPWGRKRWTGYKYRSKLKNIERVISDIATLNKRFPTLLGVAEVENRKVMEDLISTPELTKAGYKIIHYDSPDQRGVDVALLYRPNHFKIEGSSAIKTTIPDIPKYRSRDILTAWGTIDNEEFFVAVIHWASRSGGKDESEHLREANGSQMRHIIDSVQQIRPQSRIIIMGDFNDNPYNLSIRERLRAKDSMQQLKATDLYTPFYTLLMIDGYGTLVYRDEWYLFDNIIISGNMTAATNEGLCLQKSLCNDGHYGNIFKPNYLIQSEGHFAGYPFRSFSYNRFTNGYSDHLPVFINIQK